MVPPASVVHISREVVLRFLSFGNHIYTFTQMYTFPGKLYFAFYPLATTFTHLRKCTHFQGSCTLLFILWQPHLHIYANVHISREVVLCFLSFGNHIYTFTQMYTFPGKLYFAFCPLATTFTHLRKCTHFQGSCTLLFILWQPHLHIYANVHISREVVLYFLSFGNHIYTFTQMYTFPGKLYFAFYPLATTLTHLLKCTHFQGSCTLLFILWQPQEILLYMNCQNKI